MSDKLLNAYSGERADIYDSRRQNRPRWKDEEQAMSDLLAAVPAEGGILDCPFGTGRWNSVYDVDNRKVIGVDLSADMLSQARGKLAPERSKNYDLREGSIFDLSSIVPDADRQNLMCFNCIRFLNWVDFESADKVVGETASLGLDYAIFGVSLLPKEEGMIKQLHRKIRLRYLNYRVPHKPDQYVHCEKKFGNSLARHGFDVITQKFIFENPTRKNYFFLCRRS